MSHDDPSQHELEDGLEIDGLGGEGPEAEPSGEHPPERPAAGYLARSRDPVNALILATPLFVIYQIGILVTDGWKNGVDFVTQRIFDMVGRSTALYVLLNLAVLAAILLAARLIRHERRLTGGTWLFALLESAIYAGLLGGVITRVLTLIGLEPVGLSRSVGDNLVLSLGAGAYEELVFRLGLLSGLLWLGQRLKMRKPIAMLVAFSLSSLLFAAAHYHPLGNEDWQLWSFAYRTMAGMLFGALYLWRGFAVAAYTHALYDVHVLVLS